MPTMARPEVDVLEGLTTAIIVDQERMGGDSRSTVGTATDATAMLRILYSRLGKPAHRLAQRVLVQRALGHGQRRRSRSSAATRRSPRRRRFNRLGGMCPRCEGRGSVNDFDLTALYDEDKSLNEGALTIPGYSMDGWYGRIFKGCGYFDTDKPIKKFNKKEMHDLLYKEPTKIKVEGINLTYAGLIPQIQKSFLSKDIDALQPHIRRVRGEGGGVHHLPRLRRHPARRGGALVEDQEDQHRRRLRDADHRSGRLARQASKEKSVAPLIGALQHTLDSFVEIGLGYLSLDRPSGTLSGGEAQRTKMIRQLGSSLTDVTYVFDEPTIGLHPHDIERMNELLLRLRDKGNTVLVVEHKPEAIGNRRPRGRPRARRRQRRGEVVFEGTVEAVARQRHRHRPPPGRPRRAQGHRCASRRRAGGARRGPATTYRTSTWTSRSACWWWSPAWPARARAR